ncbi:hypothetical protein [Saccharopolyspora spinosa]|uniref:hypothetical protein n=1 Tax=Saccharopolyspora spinosa TaxID=60894 RepID=UPI000237870B|nr:hypothetical protein [Saccharopolyspora spinosa]
MTTLSLHGATTLLYAAPVSTELLSQLPLDNLVAEIFAPVSAPAQRKRSRAKVSQ